MDRLRGASEHGGIRPDVNGAALALVGNEQVPVTPEWQLAEFERLAPDMTPEALWQAVLTDATPLTDPLIADLDQLLASLPTLPADVGFAIRCATESSRSGWGMVAVTAQAPWQAGTAVVDWVPAFNEPAARSHQAFADPAGQTVGLHLSYYRDQDAQRKLVNSQNQLVTTDNPRWARVSAGATTAQAQGRPLPLATGLLRTQGDLAGGAGQRLLVWHFYWVNDRFVAGDARGKLQSALGRELHLSSWVEADHLGIVRDPSSRRHGIPRRITTCDDCRFHSGDGIPLAPGQDRYNNGHAAVAFPLRPRRRPPPPPS